jgi:hypothetical protein
MLMVTGLVISFGFYMYAFHIVPHATDVGVADSPLAKREIIQRLGTSPTQLHRLLDQTDYHKSIDKMPALPYVLDCDFDLLVRAGVGPDGAVRDVG